MKTTVFLGVVVTALAVASATLPAFALLKSDIRSEITNMAHNNSLHLKSLDSNIKSEITNNLRNGLAEEHGKSHNALTQTNHITDNNGNTETNHQATSTNTNDQTSTITHRNSGVHIDIVNQDTTQSGRASAMQDQQFTQNAANFNFISSSINNIIQSAICVLIGACF